jgi:acyl transferase domain-containing protein
MEEAIICAYYRGYVMTKQTLDGGMAAIGLGAHEVSEYLCEGVVLACENSPNSSTISGDAAKVRDVMEDIKHKIPGVFIRALQVDMAYHSRKMLHFFLFTDIADEWNRPYDTPEFRIPAAC